ncbi:ribose-5-phosphate isomerase RpiA [Sphingomonas nostoxanthinifaciens]|uniref:ribose-5-phosphate isomerase RpiA n=1 Tax=Sphingomonas nostoxanthinifaciens TaxID=2872652 RepID=UPI001CC20043|nr:ribose-5-phosphate isomerase RpiA [Sphingomonas nostoxanthinifaciens]UAK23514.1 ribose-5-phosphate isomerase RpiA [Sphingomonas nostoxanthinifaciens]
MSQADDKRAAALAAADEVRSGMRIGLGTGSTAFFLIEELGRRRAAGLDFTAVATSRASEEQARAAGILLLDPSQTDALDLAIDGADEIDPQLRAIKGAGGAMLREKVVGAAAARMIVIVDGSKRVDRLGAAPVPIEVLPFAEAFVAAQVRALGGRPDLRRAADGPYRTDQGNAVLDCHFDMIGDPAALAVALATIPGALGHGLFVEEVDAIYVAVDGVVEKIERSAALRP